MHPILAIIGRPNVGKSRLFNRLVGRTKAIVADTPGITRDRHYAPAEWGGREFIAVDTGGLEFDPSYDLEKAVSKQSLTAIAEADIVVCVFDAQTGPTPVDREIVSKLRVIKKPVIYAVNKIDESTHNTAVSAFHELGISPLVAVSAEHGRGVDDLLDEAVRLFPPEKSGPLTRPKGTQITVVGRPNVGKSTLINRLAGEDRVVAHEMPGTTRDAIDVEIEFENKKYVFIDTAGVKKHWGAAERIEKWTAIKSLKTIDRTQIVLQLIDAKEGLTKQDLNLTGFVCDEHKGLILLVNKWDEMKVAWPEYERDLKRAMGELKDVSVMPLSAKTGFNCLKIFPAIEKLDRSMGKKVRTSALNKIVETALANHHLPVYRGKQVRIYYATQTGTYPPTISLFANFPAAVPYTYRRYLTKALKEELGGQGAPLKLVCRKK